MEQSVGIVVGKVVETIELEHCCIEASMPRAVHSTKVVVEHKVERNGSLVGSDTEMQRTKEGCR